MSFGIYTAVYTYCPHSFHTKTCFEKIWLFQLLRHLYEIISDIVSCSVNVLWLGIFYFRSGLWSERQQCHAEVDALHPLHGGRRVCRIQDGCQGHKSSCIHCTTESARLLQHPSLLYQQLWPQVKRIPGLHWIRYLPEIIFSTLT